MKRSPIREEWTSADGSVRLLRGDATQILPTLPDSSIDLIFTDPPYGHNNNAAGLSGRYEQALGRKRAAAPRPIAGDGPEATELVAVLFSEAARLLRCCCCCCCCGGGGGPDPQFARWSLLMDEHLWFEQMIVWDKGPIGLGWKYRRSYETVLVGSRSRSPRWFDSSRRIENVIRPGMHGIKKRIPSKDEHPMTKPPELAAHFMRLHTQPGELVLDPFLGGGSTAVAAVREGRRFLGIELDRKYFRMAVRRIRAALAESQALQEADA